MKLSTLPFAHLLGINRAKRVKQAAAVKVSTPCEIEADFGNQSIVVKGSVTAVGGLNVSEAALSRHKATPHTNLGASPTKATCQSERARMKAIVEYGIKNGCVNEAAVYAFETSMAAEQAISLLASTKAVTSVAKQPTPATTWPEARMASAGIAADILHAGAKARGETL